MEQHSMRSIKSKHNHILGLLLLVVVISGSFSTSASMELFQVKFIELDGARLIATSNYNYAISSPKLSSKNWRTVSVNGDTLLATTTTGEKVPTTKAAIDPKDLQLIESLREEIANGNGGYRHMSTAGGTGGSNFMMSSNEGTGSSSSSSSSSFSSASTTAFGSNTAGPGQFGGTRSGEMSYSMKDANNYSIARSDLPFGWSRVFVNDDLITFVSKNGDVLMLPINSLEPDQLEAVNKLKGEIVEMQRTQSQQFANTMQNSMDMVSNIFSNIMGNFPAPPKYETAVGNMFGSNFPFGPNNSPFSASSGWPFANGPGAVAFASARR